VPPRDLTAAHISQALANRIPEVCIASSFAPRFKKMLNVDIETV